NSPQKYVVVGGSGAIIRPPEMHAVPLHTENLNLPLTMLSEDEQLFHDSVVQFADREIRPLVRIMDEHAKIADGLLAQLFVLGVMGIEATVAAGGSGRAFLHPFLAVAALSRRGPSIGVLVDVQNTLVINALLRWADPALRHRYLPKLAS